MSKQSAGEEVDLAELGRQARESKAKAKEDADRLRAEVLRRAFLPRALEEYGYLHRLAREAGYPSSYVTKIVDKKDPTWRATIKSAIGEKRAQDGR